MEVGVGMDWGGGEGVINWVLVGMVNILRVEAGVGSWRWRPRIEAGDEGWKWRLGMEVGVGSQGWRLGLDTGVGSW